jgi:hypothetical protein
VVEFVSFIEALDLRERFSVKYLPMLLEHFFNGVRIVRGTEKSFHIRVKLNIILKFFVSYI